MIRNPAQSPRYLAYTLTLATSIWMALGCAGQTIDTERLLSAAGFQLKLANSPEQKANLTTLPQHKISVHEMNGEQRFVYADSKYCKCMYVGTEKAYQRYERFAMRQRISDQRLQSAQLNNEATMNWGMWGPWGPWY